MAPIGKTMTSPMKRSADQTSSAAALKRAHVPAVAPLDSARRAEVVGTPPNPVLPKSCSDADVNVSDVMRGVIAYVRHHLKEHMKGNPKYFAGFADMELHAHPPLGIKTPASETELLSFKAPWTQQSARTSLESTEKYEAGGNIFWINPFTSSDEEMICAGGVPSWEAVNAMADVFRLPEGASTPFCAGPVAKGKRMMFSVVLVVHADKMEALASRGTFPGSLKLVTGHAALWGWYLAACGALDVGNSEHVALLWQAALTASLQAHILESPEQLALLSMKTNNEHCVIAQSLAETFPGFARKLALATQTVKSVADRLKFCEAHGLRFNGSSVHRTLLLAATKYVETVNEDTHQRLMRIERMFGKEALSGRWANLNRLLQVCGKEAQSAPQLWNGLEATRLVDHVLDYILWGLKHEEVEPLQITQAWLDKGRDGTPGTIARVLAKVQLVGQCEASVLELPEGSKSRGAVLGLLEHFRSYCHYDQHFASASTPGEDCEDGPDPFETTRADLCKMGCAVLDFFFDLFANENDKDLNDLIKKNTGAIAMLPWQDLAGQAGQRWREVGRMLGVHKQIVSASNPDAPPQSSRSLRRTLTADGGDNDEARTSEMREERGATWKRSGGTDKYAQVSCANVQKHQDLQA